MPSPRLRGSLEDNALVPAEFCPHSVSFPRLSFSLSVRPPENVLPALPTVMRCELGCSALKVCGCHTGELAGRTPAPPERGVPQLLPPTPPGSPSRGPAPGHLPPRPGTSPCDRSPLLSHQACLFSSSHPRPLQTSKTAIPVITELLSLPPSPCAPGPIFHTQKAPLKHFSKLKGHPPLEGQGLSLRTL